jgi:hypothetical protein
MPCSDSLDDFTKCLARFEEGYLLPWHFDSRSSFWIPSDAQFTSHGQRLATAVLAVNFDRSPARVLPSLVPLLGNADKC